MYTVTVHPITARPVFSREQNKNVISVGYENKALSIVWAEKLSAVLYVPK